MRFIKTAEQIIDGRECEIEFYADDDCCLLKIIKDANTGEELGEETIAGECACRECCEHRDWKEFV